MTDFIRKYGGTRQSIPDNVKILPVCPTHGYKMIDDPQVPGRYWCSGCRDPYIGERLKGVTWVRSDTGRVVISPPSTQVD